MTPKNANPNPEPGDAEQSKRFGETARAIEADRSGNVFERVLGVVVKHSNTGNSNEPLTRKTTPTIVTRKGH